MGEAVKIDGLAAFVRAVKKADAELPKMLRVALNGCATFLINKARPLIPTVKGAAARSLKARSTRTAVRVAAGGDTAPYYPWLDFGGHVGQHGSTARPFFKEGRYLYPTLRENRDEFGKIIDEALADTARKAGIEVDRHV
jgi:hypothetical protein